MANDVKDCTGCGYCCKTQVCLFQMLAGDTPPCAKLVYKGGRYWCGLILETTGERRDEIAQSLAIGQGCIGDLMAAKERERMPVKFDQVQEGDLLWDVRKAHGRLSTWPVKVLQIDHEKGYASCSWNNNKPTHYTKGQLERLRRKRPRLRD